MRDKPKSGMSRKAKLISQVPDEIIMESDDRKYRKRSLQDKMNRAPEFNKGIAKGKRDFGYSNKV